METKKKERMNKIKIERKNEERKIEEEKERWKD